MKLLICAALIVSVYALGEDQCSWGPAQWCSSLRTAKQCGAYQHCKTTVWATSTAYNKDKTEVCDFCKNIIGDVRKFLTANETESYVRQYMDSACNLIPIAELAEQCKTTVDSDLKELFDLIKSELDPAAICACIGLCQGFVDNTLHAVPVPELHRVALSKPSTHVMSLPSAPEDICTDCKKLMQDFKDQLVANATEAQVEAMLKDQVCSQLGPLKDECDQMVSTYVPELLEMLDSMMDPAQTCAALGMCPNGDVLLLVKMRLRKSPLYKALSSKTDVNSDECSFCKLVFEELQDVDRNTAVQKEVEDFVTTNLCAKLGAYADVCTSTVETYGQMLFELLANELDPDTRCKAIGFCTSGMPVAQAIREAMPAKPVQSVQSSPVKASTGCIMCEFVMNEVEQLLKQNNTVEELVADLEKVCSIMPDTIKAECDDFIETYGPAVIELLIQELDPQVICTTIGLCRAQLDKPKAGSDEWCGICETVIQYLDSVLAENATEVQIKKDLERICNFLPDTIKETCDQMVEQYMDAIIKLVTQGLTPKQICTELGLCTAGADLFADFKKVAPVIVSQNIEPEVIVPEKAALLGTNECTYGPSFWCLSEENAKKCRATSHCQEKVWPKK